MPRLREFYPGICLTTEEKARKNLSQGKKNLSQSTVYILPTHPHKQTHYKTHTYTYTHTHTNTHTNTHIAKQYKTTTVQIKHSARYTQVKQSQYNQIPAV